MKKVQKMKLKRKISKDEHEKLADGLKEVYVESNGDYIIDMEDTGFEQLKAEKKALQDKLNELEVKEKEAEAEKARRKEEQQKKDGKWEELNKSYAEKIEKLEKDAVEQKANYERQIGKNIIDREVDRICNEIATSPALLRPHVASRFDVEFGNGEAKLYIKDVDGKRSAMTVKELEKSLIDNADFSAIIKQNAGGASKTNPNSFSGTKPETNGNPPATSKRITDMTPDELAVYAENLANSM